MGTEKSRLFQFASGHTFENPFITHEVKQTASTPAKLATQIQETYGQCNEDLIVESMLKVEMARLGRPMSSIRYVEIGANNPIQTSNSYLLYRKHGAQGVLCEADPGLIGNLRQARPRDTIVHAAITAGASQPLRFYVCALAELSSLDKNHILSFGRDLPISEIDVPGMNVNDMLQRHAPTEIDFLSIDVEGLDLALMRAIDFVACRPRVMQCEPSEHYTPGAADEMVALMNRRGYALAAVTDVNLIFRDAMPRVG